MTLYSPYNPVTAPKAPPPLVTAGERDRRISETLQRVLLRAHPRETLPGLSVEAFYAAALEEASVGGDSFDAFPLTGGRIALAVADASGKGLAAAERAAEVRFALRAFLREHHDPRQALSCLNDFVCAAQVLGGRDVGSFTTLSLIVLHQASGEVACLCAGGEPPLILRSCGAVEAVPVCGSALGLFPDLPYESNGASLRAGDTLLMATDGITEARQRTAGDPPGSRGRAFLGLEGLAQLARQAGPMGRGALFGRGQEIFENARAFAGGTFHDDACLLVARWERFSGSAGTVR